MLAPYRVNIVSISEVGHGSIVAILRINRLCVEVAVLGDLFATYKSTVRRSGKYMTVPL